MRDKVIRFTKAFTNESVRRLPYIILLLVVLSLVQFIRISNQTAESVRIATGNSIDNKSLLKKVAALSEDNKNLTKQNIQIAKESATHLDCVADLFARYTRDQSPVLKVDLMTCFIKSGEQTPATPGQNAAQPSISNLGAPSVSSPQSAPSASPQQSNIPQAVPVPQQNVVNRILNSILSLINPFN